MFDRSILRVSEQLEVEKVLAEDNSKKFVLAHEPLIFTKEIIKRIRDLGQTKCS